MFLMAFKVEITDFVKDLHLRTKPNKTVKALCRTAAFYMPQLPFVYFPLTDLFHIIETK